MPASWLYVLVCVLRIHNSAAAEGKVSTFRKLLDTVQGAEQSSQRFQKLELYYQLVHMAGAIYGEHKSTNNDHSVRGEGPHDVQIHVSCLFETGEELFDIVVMEAKVE